MFRFFVSLSFVLFVFSGFASAGFEGIDSPPENEDQMIRSWVKGFWQGADYRGRPDRVNFRVDEMSAREHDDFLQDRVDFLLNCRIGYEAASSAVFKHRRGSDLPYYFFEGHYRHRDYIVSQIIGIRAMCGGGPISMGYAAQQFRSLALVEKAVENIEGEWASTRFLAARFLNDLRLLNKLLRTEQDERVLMMLCIRASGHVAARGQGYEQLRKLVVDTIPSIRSPLFLRTLSMFCEESPHILRKLSSSDDPATQEIASWRIRNLR